MLCLATPVAAQEIAVPSGQPLEFIEVIVEDTPRVARFRFLAPEIEARGFEAVSEDFPVLCAEIALPALEANALEVEQIVISMSAAPVPFGEPAPGIAQFFELFRPEDGACIWEYF